MQSAVGPAESAEVTPRQRELLRLMADGLDTEDAALALGVSPETVKTHVEGVMSKLGASGRTEAVAIAFAAASFASRVERVAEPGQRCAMQYA